MPADNAASGDAAPANPKAAYARSPIVKAPSSPPPAVAGPKATYARSPLFKEPPPTDPMSVDEPEVPFDTDWECDEDVDKRVGLRFIPINHQCITKDQRNVRILLITVHLPNGIQNLVVEPSADGSQLLIRGSAPRIISDVSFMAESLVMTSTDRKVMEDALTPLRRPDSQTVRVYGEVDLLEPTSDSHFPDLMQGHIDPNTRAAVILVRLMCAKSQE
jgi:hypothetical protein